MFRESQNHALKPIAVWLVTAFVVLVGVATTVQVYRIGDSGANATWHKQMQAGADAS